MRLREIFALNLKSNRRGRNLSQEELADLAEIDRTYVSLLERSEYSASLDMIERLARALEVPPLELLRTSKANEEYTP
ncbi:helix-turn-helix transcriptional regulator [Henriciella sp.]|jgi:transcriptional regulator with XRE-family HTH domain|uniref:helix-turn-helix domain-containing protein n=1 Tax=Henriciella sp. TaxID=1968823 RepID=UPI000C50A7F5|nr:helix-turn-helix transcriptional regulator [Henriciella sp.]MAN74206.1 transcriptional regulator [Henriciella sp.]|tara:strand:- start:258 stop:491 length:234 start_codon:yes stop_codon:yes gene_type:complete